MVRVEVMPMRALPIPAAWSPDDLYHRYIHAPTVAIGRRYHALYLRRLGHPPGAVAALLGVSTQAIREWVALARDHGLDRLARRAGGDGRAPKLTANQQATVVAWVDAEPKLMLKHLQARIAERWDIDLSTTQIWHLLKRHEARRVVPRTRHYQADPAARRRFKKSPAADAPGMQGAISAAVSR
jgi:transposase